MALPGSKDRRFAGLKDLINHLNAVGSRYDAVHLRQTLLKPHGPSSATTGIHHQHELPSAPLTSGLAGAWQLSAAGAERGC